jgi:hyperosmotically inducible periplasmic protein
MQMAHFKNTIHKDSPMKTLNKRKQNISANKVLMITCLAVVLGLAGCEQEGTAEKAGKEIDQATEKAGEKIEGAKESVIDKAKSAGEYIDDSIITTSVKTAILNDSYLKASKIEVTTVNGVVKLSGTVDSEQSISRAKEVASSQKNVKSVETELVVNATPPPPSQ